MAHTKQTRRPSNLRIEFWLYPQGILILIGIKHSPDADRARHSPRHYASRSADRPPESLQQFQKPKTVNFSMCSRGTYHTMKLGRCSDRMSITILPLQMTILMKLE